jgi:hypothetical protein
METERNAPFTPRFADAKIAHLTVTLIPETPKGAGMMRYVKASQQQSNILSQ